jgi:hypothetical protein
VRKLPPAHYMVVEHVGQSWRITETAEYWRLPPPRAAKKTESEAAATREAGFGPADEINIVTTLPMKSDATRRQPAATSTTSRLASPWRSARRTPGKMAPAVLLLHSLVRIHDPCCFRMRICPVVRVVRADVRNRRVPGLELPVVRSLDGFLQSVRTASAAEPQIPNRPCPGSFPNVSSFLPL